MPSTALKIGQYHLTDSSHRPSSMLFSCPPILLLLLLLGSSSDGAVYYNYRSIHDISSPIRAGQTTWGLSNGLKGTFLNETSKIVKMSTHMGTHVDSPAHAYQKMFKGHDVAALNIHTLNGMRIIIHCYIYTSEITKIFF